MSKEQLIEAGRKWLESPIIRHYSLFDNTIWDKQKEVLWAMRNYPKVAVKSGNTVGKTYIAAQVVVDYMVIYKPCKVITTAPTFTQVEDILWKEIAHAHRTTKIPFPGELLKTEWKVAPDKFAMGISTNEVNRFQGFHSPNLLVVIDEALGVAPEIWEAIEGLHPHRILAIGNPLESMGNFFNCFSSPLWHKITINCEDAVKWQEENEKIPGLVTKEWINERAEDWGRGSPLFEARVLGEFPSESPDTLISRKWVEDARKRVNEDDSEEDGPRVGACDVATKHGNNETVIGYRYGHTLKEIKGHVRIPTTDTADRMAWLNSDKRLNNLVIDSDGVGEGVSDILIAKRIGVSEFHGGYGQKAIDTTKFRNLRTQFYWIVAKKFEKGEYDLSQIPEKEYELLKNQLCSVKVKPPDAMGRIQIETKEDMHQRGITSPDYADCFVYLEYAFWSSRFEEIRPFKYC